MVWKVRYVILIDMVGLKILGGVLSRKKETLKDKGQTRTRGGKFQRDQLPFSIR